MSESSKHGRGGPKDDYKPFLDSEDARRNAAWYEAGVNSFGTYSFLSGLIVSPLAGFTTLIFSGDGARAVVAVLIAQILSTALVSTYLGFRARTVVRTVTVQVAPF